MTDRFQPLSAKRAAPDPKREGRFALEVRWADGHTSVFPWGYLRGLCPCAQCRDGVLERVRAGDAADMPAGPMHTAEALQHVGHYALGVRWGDSHESILPWEYLRRLDPDEAPIDARVAYVENLRK